MSYAASPSIGKGEEISMKEKRDVEKEIELLIENQKQIQKTIDILVKAYWRMKVAEDVFPLMKNVLEKTLKEAKKTKPVKKEKE